MLLNFVKEAIIMIRIVMRQNQPLDFSALSAFDRLQVTGVTPAGVAGKFLRCVLGVMEKKVGTAAELNDVWVQVGSMFNVGTKND